MGEKARDANKGGDLLISWESAQRKAEPSKRECQPLPLSALTDASTAAATSFSLSSLHGGGRRTMHRNALSFVTMSMGLIAMRSLGEATAILGALCDNATGQGEEVAAEGVSA